MERSIASLKKCKLKKNQKPNGIVTTQYSCIERDCLRKRKYSEYFKKGFFVEGGSEFCTRVNGQQQPWSHRCLGVYVILYMCEEMSYNLSCFSESKS